MQARLPPSIIAVVAALLTAGCGGSVLHHSSSRSAPATLTATAGPMIPWRKVALPAGVDLQQNATGFAVSPVDGHVAWVCAPSSPGHFAIWSTSDAGATWRQTSTLTPATPESPSGCGLAPDTNDTQAVTAGFSWGCGECGTLAGMGYYSIDGGTHWSKLASVIHQIVRGGATTYAIVSNATAMSAPTTPPLLVASTDALRTWHTISPGGPGAHGGVVNFSAAPSSGELLAATQDGALWHSINGGSTWSQLTLTRMARSPQDYGLSWLGGQDRWMICANGLNAANSFFCSTDLGDTWWQIRVPTYTSMCPTCGKGFPITGQVTACQWSGPSEDGSFLAACPSTIPTGIEPYHGTYTVESLAFDATDWNAVGIAPGGGLEVTGHGMLWCRDFGNDTLNALYVAPEP